jgi:hypothetical protein
MDEKTLIRLENYRQREQDADYSLGLIEYCYYSRLPYGWKDVINYTYQKTKEGVARLRIKELFIQEELEEKIDAILIEDVKLVEKNCENNE